MQRSNNPKTARKPPIPSESHAEIDAWMRRAMPDLQPILRHIDGLLREEIPGLQFALKWKKAHYGLSKLGWIAEVVAYDVSVNVVFYAGATFDPPPPLGTTGTTRYVKLATLEEAQNSQLRRWIEQAGRTPGWK